MNSSLLEVKDVTYAYPDGRKALNGISLEINAGEKVGIVGSNGAGKSTFLLHLNGILQGSGEIRVAGKKVEPSSLGEVRALVGLVFQDPDDQLFSPTVFQDVAFGPLYMGLGEEEVNQRVDLALELVGMSGMRDRVPHHMSLGERKMAAIATVLSMQPSLLALDEPTSALDAQARRRLLEVLKGLDGVTLLVATHDLALVKDVLERTVVFDGGRVVADGPTTEILRDRELLERHGL